eukprot:Hpha_TRINITY_DN11796_c0_g1::TRINITY_DN11796_c0_g1_i1::g.31741::m.31741
MAVEADVQRLFAALERLKPTAEEGQEALVGGVADGLRRRYKALDVDDAFAESDAPVAVSAPRKTSDLQPSERQLLADTLRECGFGRVAERYEAGIILEALPTERPSEGTAENGRAENSFGPVSPIGRDATLTATSEPPPPEVDPPSKPPPAELYSSRAPVIRVTSPTPPAGSVSKQQLLQVPSTAVSRPVVEVEESAMTCPPGPPPASPPPYARYDAAAEELELAQLRERHARAVQLQLAARAGVASARPSAPPSVPPSAPPSCTEAAAAAVHRAAARCASLHSSAAAEAAVRAAECDARAAARLRLSSAPADLSNLFLPTRHALPLALVGTQLELPR